MTAHWKALALAWTPDRIASLPLWLRSLIYGLLWAMAIVAGEALSLPMDQFDAGGRAVALGWIFVSWVPVGVCMAWIAFESERRRIPLWLTGLLLLAAAVALGGAECGLWWMQERLQLRKFPEVVVGSDAPSWNIFFYIVWMSMYHGVLFVAGCMLALRIERTRKLLGDAQIARGKTEALLADARFDALRARIDPAFLLRAMGAVQQRYADDPAAADALLERLVGFLRQAMPGVRGGTSTLVAELQLAEEYVHLCECMDPLRARWVFRSGDAPADALFPPLLLLPMLDELTPADADADADAEGDAGSVVCTQDAGGWRLAVTAAGGELQLSKDLLYRLQVAIKTTFGERGSLQLNGEALAREPTLILRVRGEAATVPDTPEGEPSFFVDEEVNHALRVSPIPG